MAARKARFAATASDAARDAGRLVHVLRDYEEPGGRLGSAHDALRPISQGARVRRVLQEQLTGSVQAA